MEYTGTFNNTVARDELFGGGDGFPVELINVEIASDTTVTRGELLAGDTPKGTFAAITSTDDAEKYLVIAAENYTAADSDSTVTSCYSAGKFNREKIILAEGLDIDNFENALRKQNIILTSLKEIF